MPKENPHRFRDAALSALLLCALLAAGGVLLFKASSPPSSHTAAPSAGTTATADRWGEPIKVATVPSVGLPKNSHVPTIDLSGIGGGNLHRSTISNVSPPIQSSGPVNVPAAGVIGTAAAPPTTRLPAVASLSNPVPASDYLAAPISSLATVPQSVAAAGPSPVALQASVQSNVGGTSGAEVSAAAGQPYGDPNDPSVVAMHPSIRYARMLAAHDMRETIRPQGVATTGVRAAAASVPLVSLPFIHGKGAQPAPTPPPSAAAAPSPATQPDPLSVAAAASTTASADAYADASAQTALGVPDEDNIPLIREALRLENARKFVMSMCQDQQGRLWVGCENEQPGDGTGGVQCYDPSKPPLRAWTQYLAKDGLGDDNGYAIACDRLNRIWVGHLNHGVSVYNQNPQGHWQCYEVVGGLSQSDTLSGPLGERVFCIKMNPKDGDVWIATNCGLARYSESRNTWQYYTCAEGLPSDQANDLAFAEDGKIYVATQCDGIAIGEAAENYQEWRRVAGTEEATTAPTRRCLPSSIINSIIVGKSNIFGKEIAETVYVATVSGLAYSTDGGKTFKIFRGKDQTKRPSTTNGELSELQTAQSSEILGEDNCTCLASDLGGNVWIGHWHTGCELVVKNSSTGQLTSLSRAFPNKLVKALLPMKSFVAVASYGSGVLIVDSRAPKTSVLYSRRSGKTAVLPLQASECSVWSDTIMKKEYSRDLLSYAGAEYLGDDYHTRGNWFGRYGSYWACLASVGSPRDVTVQMSNSPIAYTVSLGKFRYKGDSVRHFISTIPSSNVNALELPRCSAERLGFKRDAGEPPRCQAEWDDHGEVYPTSIPGPNLECTLRIPKGRFQLSLYFVNKDGHTGDNRYRDYVVAIYHRPYGIPLGEMMPVLPKDKLAHCRVTDFWNGVYKRFVIEGPADYTIVIQRNGSINTIASGLFIDDLAESDLVATAPREDQQAERAELAHSLAHLETGLRGVGRPGEKALLDAEILLRRSPTAWAVRGRCAYVEYLRKDQSEESTGQPPNRGFIQLGDLKAIAYSRLCRFALRDSRQEAIGERSKTKVFRSFLPDHVLDPYEISVVNRPFVSIH